MVPQAQVETISGAHHPAQEEKEAFAGAGPRGVGQEVAKLPGLDNRGNGGVGLGGQKKCVPPFRYGQRAGLLGGDQISEAGQAHPAGLTHQPEKHGDGSTGSDPMTPAIQALEEFRKSSIGHRG
jgi:hypothetical protein